MRALFKRIGLLIFVALSVLCRKCEGADAKPTMPTNQVTADSIARDLEQQFSEAFRYRDVMASYLLAFKAEVDDRPVYVESALLAIELTNSEWRLVHACRNPKGDKAEERLWQVAEVNDAPFTGSRDYSHRPKGKEVEKFLRDTWWQFKASEDFRLLRGEVYSETWKTALGYAPNHQFPKRVQAPRKQ